MILLSIPLGAKIILVAILIVCIVLAFKYVQKSFCSVHWRLKDLKAYHPFDETVYCSKCVEEETNPNVKCSCGWKGKLNQTEYYTTWDDTIETFHCPECEKEINV